MSRPKPPALAVGCTHMLSDQDRDKAGRVTRAFMPMKKFDIAKLRKAFEGTAD